MKYTFSYEGEEIEYEVRKTRGRRLSLKISEQGDIELCIPARCSMKEAQEFFASKIEWIVKTREEALEALGDAYRQFLEGDVLYYRGKAYSLHLQETGYRNHVYVECVGDQIIVKGADLTPQLIKYALEKWYIERARVRFRERCAYFAPKLGVKYQRISIKNQKSRWGSCSSKSNLNFNFRLIMGEDAALDYVVVHELCHLIEMNHSEKFWKLVASILPDYKAQEDWLEKEGKHMLNW